MCVSSQIPDKHFLTYFKDEFGIHFWSQIIKSLYICAIGSKNYHYFHIIGEGHNPNSRGLHTHIQFWEFPTEGGMTISNLRSLEDWHIWELWFHCFRPSNKYIILRLYVNVGTFFGVSWWNVLFCFPRAGSGQEWGCVVGMVVVSMRSRWLGTTNVSMLRKMPWSHQDWAMKNYPCLFRIFFDDKLDTAFSPWIRNPVRSEWLVEQVVSSGFNLWCETRILMWIEWTAPTISEAALRIWFLYVQILSNLSFKHHSLSINQCCVNGNTGEFLLLVALLEI